MIQVVRRANGAHATDRMVQVHGGYGYIDDYSIARMYRNARALDLMGGTQLMRVGSPSHCSRARASR